MTRRRDLYCIVRNLSFSLLFLPVCLSAQSKIIIRPIPDWVKPCVVSKDAAISTSEISNGYFNVLLDDQINIVKEQTYHHLAYKIVSEAGVQNASEINFSYNPAFEKCIFHNLKVYRNGKCLDKTRTTPIKEMQREVDLEQHMYDESLSVLLVLEDIRPGDIVEYDYSIIGDNPIFDGKFYYIFYFSYQYELLEANLRILKPANRQINEKTVNSGIKPVRSSSGGIEEVVYNQKNVKSIVGEKNLPYSFNPYPSIELSEYDNWQQVGEWAKKVFAVTGNDKALANKVKEIKEEFRDTNDQVIAALRFVQDQVRYMGVEIGVNSHKPANPNKVMQQRYGDCKDKSLLFCRMADMLGVRAWPALVNSSLREGVRDNLISPRIFNHCIVKAEISGKIHWFDPTISYQRGKLGWYYTPNYAYAFIVGGESEELDTMPQNQYAKIITKESYEVNDFSGKAFLKVRTVYEGAEADNMRNSFVNSSEKNTSESLLNYYKTYFPEIKVRNKYQVEDRTDSNLFILLEEYEIAKFWTAPDSTKKNNLAVDIYGGMVRDKLRAYDATYGDRKMPFYLEYPAHLVQKIHLELPEDWNLNITDDIRNTEFLAYKYIIKNERNIIDLQLEFKTLKNEVPASKAKEFVTLFDDLLTNASGLHLTYNKETPSANSGFSVNWLMVIIFIMLSGIFVFLAVFIYRKNPRPIMFDENGFEIKPVTIGGWMVLPIIGLLCSPLFCLWSIYSGNYFNLTTWNALTLETALAYNPLWAPGLISELMLLTLNLVFSVLVIFMLFSYDKRLPKFIVALFLLRVFRELFGTIFLHSIPNIDEKLVHDSITALSRMVMNAMIWIPFFLVSKRCKETFIR